MGGGSWTSASYDAYTKGTRGMDSATYAASNLNTQEVYKARTLDKELNPKNVMRECCDTEEHPHTLPVILALDVTGSMGMAATEVAKKLGVIMGDLYDDKDIPDVEFCVMAIGDLYCDWAPIQISQFESDIRIAEQLDKVWFEGGGGGNKWESYTAAWYMGVNHCKLDCWKRGKRGIIITLGDEQLNPYLQAPLLAKYVGDENQEDIETGNLYKEASEKYEIHHISVNDRHSSYFRNNRENRVDNSWKDLLGQNYHVCTIDELAATIAEIVSGNTGAGETVFATPSDGISW